MVPQYSTKAGSCGSQVVHAYPNTCTLEDLIATTNNDVSVVRGRYNVTIYAIDTTRRDMSCSSSSLCIYLNIPTFIALALSFLCHS